MDYFVEEFKDDYIAYSKTTEEASDNLEHYKLLGFPGAVGSVDCTHVWYSMCLAGKAFMKKCCSTHEKLLRNFDKGMKT